jgi:hypothetical protein
MPSAPAKRWLALSESGSRIKKLTEAITHKQKAKRFLAWRKKKE